MTYLPLGGSPTIDNALDVNCTADDQRDVVRPQAAACDSGSVEVNGPTAVDDTDTTPFATPVTTAVLTNDTPGDNPLDPATVEVLTGSAGAAVANADGTITYTPAAGFTGSDSFDYQVCDTIDRCAMATVTISVGPPSPGPTPAPTQTPAPGPTAVPEPTPALQPQFTG